MKTTLLATLSLCAGVAVAAPSVSNVSFKQTSRRNVKISYTLSGEPGVVTFDVLTNGVSIGAANITHASGDVNRVVGLGDHSIDWAADLSWPVEERGDDCPVIEDVTIAVTAWANNAPPDVMMVDLCVPNSVFFYTDYAQLPDGGLSNDIYRTTRMVLRKIPARGVTWRMGESVTRLGSEPLHQVALTEDYYMGVFEVTQSQYAKINLGNNPSRYKGADRDLHPVEMIKPTDHLRGYKYWPGAGHEVDSWGFFHEFRKLAGLEFDLPTEAQWEYACRAGTATSLNNGTDVTTTQPQVCPNVDVVGWYGDEKDYTKCNSGGVTHRVGEKQPNAWGLYDMHGNVQEWCLDLYQEYPTSGVTVDPVGAESGSKWIMRGGSYYSRANTARSASRVNSNVASDDRGFRVVCPAVADGGH